jgi:hypothetical protein
MREALGEARHMLAAFAGAFALASSIAPLSAGHPAATLWWIDLAPLPPLVALPGVALAAIALLAGVLHDRARDLASGAALVLALAALAAGARTGWRLWTGALHAGPPVPFGCLLGLALLAARPRASHGSAPRRPGVRAATLALGAVLLPLAIEAAAGPVDDRAPADAAVVFGARVYADGRCSPALADRVRTAVALHLGHRFEPPVDSSVEAVVLAALKVRPVRLACDAG